MERSLTMGSTLDLIKDEKQANKRSVIAEKVPMMMAIKLGPVKHWGVSSTKLNRVWFL
jgi:hypothetical protein